MDSGYKTQKDIPPAPTILLVHCRNSLNSEGVCVENKYQNLKIPPETDNEIQNGVREPEDGKWNSN